MAEAKSRIEGRHLTYYLTPRELREYDEAFRIRDWDAVRYLHDIASGRVPPEATRQAS